ncbi:MAG: sensor histidine kinase [Candidatus Methylumidiphilus sp.]
MTPIDTMDAMSATGRRERFLPDFRSLGCTLVLLLLGQVLAFMFTLAAAASPDRFWSELGLNSLFIMWVVLTCQAVLAVVAKRLDRMAAAGAGLCVVAAALATSGLLTWLVCAASPQAIGSLGAEGDPLFQSVGNALLAGLVAAVGLRYQYVQYLRRLQTKAEGAARLVALQSRMRPHFLFNSLNAIASLIRRNPVLAEELILDLAELFRAILRKDVQLATLGEELTLSRQYLNIEQQRLGERLRVAWSVDEDVLAALIPPLSLQPLVENAVYHGIEPMPEGGLLEISCAPHKKSLIVLSVRNSLPNNAALEERAGNRIALDNLRLRLQNFFGEEGKLMTSISDGCYQVRIIIPYKTRRSFENSASR